MTRPKSWFIEWRHLIEAPETAYDDYEKYHEIRHSAEAHRQQSLAKNGERFTNHAAQRLVIRGACIAERYKQFRPPAFYEVKGVKLTMDQWIRSNSSSSEDWYDNHIGLMSADAVQRIGEEIVAAIVAGDTGYFRNLIEELEEAKVGAKASPDRIGNIVNPSLQGDGTKATRRGKVLRLVETSFERARRKNPKRIPYHEELLNEIEKLTSSPEGQEIFGVSSVDEPSITRAIKALGLNGLPKKPRRTRKLEK